MTVKIELNDADFKAVSEYAAENKISLPQFFLESALERIEDAKWQSVSRKLIKQNKKVYEALAK